MDDRVLEGFGQQSVYRYYEENNKTTDANAQDFSR